jgi:hypothetical protein
MNQCDFFTIDVANFIGKSCSGDILNEFVQSNKIFISKLKIPVVDPWMGGILYQ